jgi:hypothetical protein
VSMPQLPCAVQQSKKAAAAHRRVFSSVPGSLQGYGRQSLNFVKALSRRVAASLPPRHAASLSTQVCPTRLPVAVLSVLKRSLRRNCGRCELLRRTVSKLDVRCKARTTIGELVQQHGGNRTSRRVAFSACLRSLERIRLNIPAATRRVAASRRFAIARGARAARLKQSSAQ